MDNIYIHHDNEQVGPFTEEKIRRYLEEGRIQPTTLAWVEGAADWKPISEMLGLASTTPPPVQAQPQPQTQPQQQQIPAYAAPQAPQQNHQANPKKLILASWLMIGVTCLVALIPGVGFLTWIIAFPVLLVTFILGILTLTKGRTMQGVMILLTSLIAAPVFLVVAPIVTTAGAVAASDSGSGGSFSGSGGSESSSGEAVGGDLKTHLVGYWKSVKKNDFDDTHLYQAFSESEYFDIVGWIPYSVVGVDGNELTYAWSQDSGELGEFDRKTRVVFLSDQKMRIDYDRFSEGYVYEKIPEDQWLREKKELDDAAIQQLRQKIGETIQRLEN
jgi:hypothetical protein